ncbi:hypothetical protein LP420_12190 [Massilia sp. B-10]|nr:hypothetical protein LP420_12190 [Massilia sp. B-10]
MRRRHWPVCYDRGCPSFQGVRPDETNAHGPQCTCLIAACAVSPASNGGPLNTTVTLVPATSTTLGAGTTLRYDAVNDSRCPPDVQCIQA